jgi:hypothetical protein
LMSKESSSPREIRVFAAGGNDFGQIGKIGPCYFWIDCVIFGLVQTVDWNNLSKDLSNG